MHIADRSAEVLTNNPRKAPVQETEFYSWLRADGYEHSRPVTFIAYLIEMYEFEYGLHVVSEATLTVLRHIYSMFFYNEIKPYIKWDS